MRRNAKKYIVSVAVNGVATSQIWDSSADLRLGYSIPWKLVRQHNGTEIEILHDGGDRLAYGDRDLGNRRGVPLPTIRNLPRLPVYVSISEIDPLKPAYLISREEVDTDKAERKWRVYETTGDWVRASHVISEGEFAASQGGSESFRLVARNNNVYRIQPLIEGLTANGQELKTDLELAAEDLAALNVQHGTSAWRFQQVWADKPASLPVFTKKDPDPEGRWFRRITLNTSLACLFLTMMAFLVGQPKPEEKLPPVQFARLVLQQIPVPDVPVATAPESEGKKANTELPPTVDVPKKEVLKRTPERRVGPRERKEIGNSPSALNANNAKSAPASAKQVSVQTQLPELSAAEKLEQRLKGLTGIKSPFLAKAGEKANAVPYSENTPPPDSSEKPAGLNQTKFESDRKVQVGVLNKNLTGSLPSGEKLAGLSVTGSPGEGGTSFLSVRQEGKSGNPTAEGLTKEEVWGVIRKNLHEIRFCYETNILRNPKLQGKVIVGFTIEGQGSVLKPKVEQTELNDKILNECILARVGAWKFPAPKGNINVDVKYPFIFRRL